MIIAGYDALNWERNKLQHSDSCTDGHGIKNFPTNDGSAILLIHLDYNPYPNISHLGINR